MRLICVLLLAAAMLQVSVASNKVSCKDEAGHDVDWWYMYKLPKHYTNDPGQGHDVSGQRYFYVTSSAYDSWQLSGRRIADDNSLPGETLRPLYADAQVLLAAYNDEFPNGTVSSTGGHTKGVIATDGNTGLWLVHSVPKYPTVPQYSYPTTGEHFGQSLLCVTLDAEGVEKAGELLVYNEPHFYYERNPLLRLSEQFPSLERALKRQWRTEAPYQKEIEVRSLGGKQFRLFGKSSRANVELYNDVVAPALGVSLFVEAWRDGAGNLPDSCDTGNKVYNVEEIANQDYFIGFKTTGDHSKWAVSQESGILLHRWRVGGGDWICVGDINRQQSQHKRGGGTVCHKSARVSNLYRKLVANYEKCN
ncbi:plancitoxin-1-like [Drosophila sulfurigaster albostrigata]|uniref:plancitoxin-1-like n=1 Tax=Drosophila sulfurigaster albostrigata TaxID=89887 RepID=UPI002D21A424|nr:plancitoxin-1-like [Drosophila sulfurigaster albostrigata]